MIRLTVDLMRLRDSEIVKKNGIPGVFVPIVPNCSLKLNHNGSTSAYVEVCMYEAKSTRFEFKGMQVIPEENRDYALSNGVIRKACAWGFTGTKTVNEDDFNRIVFDD